MLEELEAASKQLQVAIERYFRVCSELQGICLEGSTPHNIRSQYAEQINQEIRLAESYESKLKRAKIAIKTSHNYAFSISPINHLPLEILTRIFHICHNSERRYVESLAAVCSRWRSIALSSCSLWSHIDYLPSPFSWSYAELLDWVYLCFSGSGQMPLDFHITAASELYNAHTYDYPVWGLCHEVAPRLRSLKLDFVGFDTQRGFDRTAHSVFGLLLSQCVPGMLKKLITEDTGCFGFFATDEDPIENLEVWALWLEMPDLRLQKLFEPITVLHLTGLFPLWTSRAYHGLVDLRLHASHEDSSRIDNTILESELVSIPNASPELRIFHFGLRIIHDGMEGGVTRASLTGLEILCVHSGNWGGRFSRVESLFRLLTPGSKPLYLSIFHDSYQADEDMSLMETKAFFPGLI